MTPREPFRVIVTSSRTWTDRKLIYGHLDALLDRYGAVDLVHGHCRTGGDAIADAWGHERARDGRLVRVERYPAPWKRLGKIAGPMRNGYMIGRGANGLLAYIDRASTGATGCASFADWASIPVRRYTTGDGNA